MADDVARSHARADAQDLELAHEAARARERELAEANARLRRGYQQALQYAADFKKTYRRLERAILQSLLGLANALEAKDARTCGHSARVAALARGIALRAGLPAPKAETIAQAALLHDLGKIGVPEGVLRKPGALTATEWEIMRRHPVVGAQIVAPLEFFDDGAIIVLHHHERQDGSGYPDGLTGEMIPLGARIVAVADVYDALTSDRPYRRALTQADAIAHLHHEAGRTLDRGLVTLAVEVISGGVSTRARPTNGTRTAAGHDDAPAERRV
jgi:putative nucleotidyltransferase with HDIG domain